MLIATPTRDRGDSVENFHHTHMRELQLHYFNEEGKAKDLSLRTFV